MNLTRLALAHPYAVIALVLLVAAMGVFGYLRTPVDLFPETAPPQVVVITIQPGASADDVEDKITEVIEKEINTLSGLENLRSTSRDAVSSIMAEFRYTKPLGEALLDVQNAIARVHGDLPAGVREPRIYRLTEASSRPLLTLALRPKEGSTKTWMDVRLLAENQITDRILALSGIADVDVFGGHRPEVRVSVDRDRLVANGVGIEEVIGVLARQNVSAPAGTVYADGSEYLIRTAGEFARLDAIRDLPIRRRGEGLLRVGDVATVELAEQDPRSIYHGNGQKAVALGIMRPDDGPTVEAIERFKQFLPRLRAEYPDIAFEITQDQQPLIDLNLGGMRLSIVQAIALTVAVIFLFLADVRAALVVGVSIPLAFLFTLSVLWLTPLTLNMVTLTGLIVAIGMVVDCSVVALENIYRHYDQMERPDAEQAAREGTNQIALAITAGMLTTVAVLVPIIFIGGYPQRTIGRVALTISTTLVASLVVAVTLVPLVASRLLTKGHRRRNLLERAAAPVDQAVSVLRDFYLYVLRKALRWRVVTLLVAGAFLVVSFRIVPPLIGGELMPPMDTGIVIVEFSAPATDSPERVERVLDRVETVIYEQAGVEMVSSVVGSEPGAISFGTGGATAQSARIAGARGPSGDSGVTQRVFGTFLTWSQERTKPVFIFATANNISDLPPEFLRKGRFDELFFVDLPTPEERKAILEVLLRNYGRKPARLVTGALVKRLDRYTGAEIESVIVDALFEAFYDDQRPLAAGDLEAATTRILPLADQMRDEIEALRRWGKANARPAS